MIDRHGKIVKVGDTIRFVDDDLSSRDNGDIGVVTEIAEDNLYADWSMTKMNQSLKNSDSFEIVKSLETTNDSTFRSVESAVDFLISKGYTVTITRS